MIRHLINFLLAWLPPSRGFAVRAVLLRLCKVEVGRNAMVCGRGWIFGRGVLRVGDDTWLSPEVVFFTHPDAPITIGSRCDVGPGVRFITGSHDIGPSTRRAGAGYARPITVGSGSWIGAGAHIMGGVSIGEGCVVAAGAVVVNDVSSNSLVAGVPAKFKRNLI